MIILRQHNYTFGEQRAIEQFMKLTHNGRAIPRGYKNLTAKDIVKLKDVAKTIDEEGIKSLNPETAKYYLNKLGFTETANNYERLVDKYNNPELIHRFKRRKLREINKPLYDQVTNLDKNVSEIDSNLDKEVKKLTKGKSFKDWKEDRWWKLEDIRHHIIGDPKRSEKDYFKIYHQLYQAGNDEVRNKIKELVNQRNEKVSNMVQKFKDTASSSPSFTYIPSPIVDRHNILIDSAKHSGNIIFKDSIKRPIVDKKLVEEQKRQLQKGPNPIKFETISDPDFHNNAAISSNKTVLVPKKFKHGKSMGYDPFTIGHEAGHLDGFANGGGSMTELVNELGASAHSAARVTPKVSKKVARKGRRQLEHTGNTYWSSFIGEKNADLGRRLGVNNNYLPFKSDIGNKDSFDYLYN